MVQAHGQLLGISYDLKHKYILVVLFLYSSFQGVVANYWEGQNDWTIMNWKGRGKKWSYSISF